MVAEGRKADDVAAPMHLLGSKGFFQYALRRSYQEAATSSVLAECFADLCALMLMEAD